MTVTTGGRSFSCAGSESSSSSTSPSTERISTSKLNLSATSFAAVASSSSFTVAITPSSSRVLMTSPDLRRIFSASSPTVTDSGTRMSSRLTSAGGAGAASTTVTAAAAGRAGAAGAAEAAGTAGCWGRAAAGGAAGRGGAAATRGGANGPAGCPDGVGRRLRLGDTLRLRLLGEVAPLAELESQRVRQRRVEGAHGAYALVTHLLGRDHQLLAGHAELLREFHQLDLRRHSSLTSP